MDKTYLTAEEAIEKLAKAGLGRSTFFRWVKEGIITKELPKGRVRGALYPRQQIEDALIGKMVDGENLPSKLKENEREAESDWIRVQDIPYVMALEWETYGPEYTVDVVQSRKWWEKNPYMCRIIFDREDRRHIWGAFTIMPMYEGTIHRILKQEMSDHDITIDDILTYEPGKKYDGYVGSMIIRPGYQSYFRQLVKSMLTFWCEQYPSIQLQKLYAYAVDEQGLGLIKHLFFSARYDLSDNAYELNLNQHNPAKIIQSFQECIQNKSTVRT